MRHQGSYLLYTIDNKQDFPLQEYLLKWGYYISASSMIDTASDTEEAEKVKNYLDAKQSSAPRFKQTTFGTSETSTLKHLLLEAVNT